MNKKQLLASIFLAFGFINMVYAKPSEQETIDYINAKAEKCQTYFNFKPGYYNNGEGEMIGQKSYDTELKIQSKKLVVKERTETYIDKIMYKYTDSDEMYRAKNRLGNLMNIFETKLYNSSTLLKDLDPNISVDGNIVTINCHSNNCFSVKKKKVTVHHLPYSVYEERMKSLDERKWKSGKSDNQNYTLCNAKTAKKIAKSLSHLIKLNGGKGELF